MKSPKYLSVLSLAVIGALCDSSAAWATPILGSDLASFTVLGYSTVTNTNPGGNLPLGPTTITGNVGDWANSVAANTVTGLLPTQVSGTIYQGPAPGTSTQALAQSQLTSKQPAVLVLLPCVDSSNNEDGAHGCRNAAHFEQNQAVRL